MTRWMQRGSDGGWTEMPRIMQRGRTESRTEMTAEMVRDRTDAVGVGHGRIKKGSDSAVRLDGGQGRNECINGLVVDSTLGDFEGIGKKYREILVISKAAEP